MEHTEIVLWNVATDTLPCVFPTGNRYHFALLDKD